MRKGIIVISNEIYENNWNETNVFMKNFRPLHIEKIHWENNNWYLWGVSEMFDLLSESEQVPHYDIIITKEENGNVSCKFERQLKR